MTPQLETILVKREGGRGVHRINKSVYDANPDKYTLAREPLIPRQKPQAPPPVEEPVVTGADIKKQSEEQDTGRADVHPAEKMVAKHTGLGQYAIMLGEEKYLTGLTKAEMQAFNEMAVPERIRFIAEKRDTQSTS